MNRPAGAYLHWSLPDELTRALPDPTSGNTVFTALPERWLVIRLTGDVRIGPRAVTAWLIETNATTPLPIADAFHAAIPPVGPAPNPALTVLGLGDLSWSAYFDNVANRLAVYDPLTGLDGSVAIWSAAGTPMSAWTR